MREILQRAHLRDCYQRGENPVRLVTGVQAQLIGRDDLVGGITIRIKALMSGNTSKVAVLDGIDDGLTERLGTSKIAGVCWGMDAVCQSRLDRLNQDVRAVISRRTIDVDGIRS